MEVKDAIQEVLESANLLSLATNDENGPWSCVLAFICDEEFNLYWMSIPDSKHQQMLLKDPKAAISITTAHKPGDENKIVQMLGKVEEYTGGIFDLEDKYKMKKNNLLYAPRHAVQGFMEKWYIFKPEFADVTYEPAWASEKRRLNIEPSE